MLLICQGQIFYVLTNPSKNAFLLLLSSKFILSAIGLKIHIEDTRKLLKSMLNKVEKLLLGYQA